MALSTRALAGQACTTTSSRRCNGAFQAPTSSRSVISRPASRASTCKVAARARERRPKYSEPPLSVAELSNQAPDQELLNLPFGYHWYETMIVLRPTLSDEERDKELAKFEAFLNKEECMHINALVRGRSRMAYPIKSNWEGIYVLYTYAAKRQTAKTVQLLLSNPEAGSEDNVLRHITLCRF